MHQAPYTLRLATLPNTASLDLFQGCRHELAWLTHNRPAFLAPVAILAQVTAHRTLYPTLSCLAM